MSRILLTGNKMSVDSHIWNKFLPFKTENVHSWNKNFKEHHYRIKHYDDYLDYSDNHNTGGVHPQL